MEPQVEFLKTKVLDDGFVAMVDHMGGDAAIVQAARVSYGEGTKTPSDDRTLIRYLMRHRHTTPFEMVEFKFLVRCPMDCWRQWIRHRTANVNEYSTRYSEAINSMQQTAPTEWRKQSKTNKQGSGKSFGNEAIALTKGEAYFHEMARELYETRLDAGVAREQARKDLPLSTYTEAYWKIDLHNLFHFLSLRMDSHAQLEIRSYANAIGDMVKQVCPLAWEAFVDYRLEAMFLTRLDLVAINKLIQEAIAAPREYQIDEVAAEVFTNKRERSEFESKAESFGF